MPKTNEPQQTTVRFTLRLDPELHRWLVDHAKRQHRTTNAQVAHILNQHRRTLHPDP